MSRGLQGIIWCVIIAALYAVLSLQEEDGLAVSAAEEGQAAYPDSVEGRVKRVGDGDSMELEGYRLRLQGVDAPELAQHCEREGQSWPCGEAARQFLAELVAGRRVSCDIAGSDRHGRLLAHCYRANLRGERLDNINARLVREGMAIAYSKQTGRYLPDEHVAKTAGVGIWDGRFQTPADWRREHARR